MRYPASLLLGLALLVSGWAGPALPSAPRTAAAAPSAEARLFMWTARGEGAVVHLLGSVHLGQEDFYPLDPAIEQAFAGSATLAVELDMSDPAVIAESSSVVVEKGVLPEGQTLRDVVPETTWRQLEAFLAEREVPVAAFERLRPAMAVLLLTLNEMQRLGYGVDEGIDLHFLQRAAPENKRIVPLETVQEQVDALLPEDQELGALLLAETMAQADSVVALIEGTIEAWRTGDAEAMEATLKLQVLDDPRLTEYHDRMLGRRNLRMAERLLAAVAPGDTFFVVVGAGHLVGPAGLPNLLAERGFAVEQARAVARETAPAPAR